MKAYGVMIPAFGLLILLYASATPGFAAEGRIKGGSSRIKTSSSSHSSSYSASHSQNEAAYQRQHASQNYASHEPAYQRQQASQSYAPHEPAYQRQQASQTYAAPQSKCGRPQSPMNGAYQCEISNERYKCTGTCKPGHAFPDGSIILEVECSSRSGVWTPFKDFPVCHGVGRSSQEERYHQQRVAGSSREEMHHQQRIAESRQGAHHTQQQRQRRTCDRPKSPVNGDIYCRDDPYSVQCQATCNPGFEFPDGSRQIILSCSAAEGSWQPRSSVEDCQLLCHPPCQNGGHCLPHNQCVCAGKHRGNRCQYPVSNCDFELLSPTMVVFVCDHLPEYTECHISCPPGHVFNPPSSPVYRCTVDGRWNPPTSPRCVRDALCDEPPSPVNGAIQCSGNHDVMICTAQCMPGFLFPEGFSELVSQCSYRTGQWTPTINFPDCEPICRPDCENNGRCVGHNQCICSSSFRGARCQYPISKCDGNERFSAVAFECQHGTEETLCFVSCGGSGRLLDPPRPKEYTCSPDGRWQPNQKPRCIEDRNRRVQMYDGQEQEANEIPIRHPPPGQFGGQEPLDDDFDGIYDSDQGFAGQEPVDYDFIQKPAEYGHQDRLEKQVEEERFDRDHIYDLRREPEPIHNSRRNEEENEINRLPKQAPMETEEVDEDETGESFDVEESSDVRGICSVWGYHHYGTFDGLQYTFPGTCTYLLASVCEAGDATINIRHVCGDSTQGPCERGVEIHLPGENFFMTPKGLNRNGLPWLVPTHLGPLSVERITRYTVARLTSGFSIWLSDDGSVHVVASDSLKGRTCGMCGNFDGSPESDRLASDGRPTLSVYEFGNSWKIHTVEGCTYEAEEEMPCSIKTMEKRMQSDQASLMCATLYSSDFADCQARVNEQFYYRMCQMDCCSLKAEDNCECASITQFFIECTRAGGIVDENWRTEALCPLECTNGTEFRECGPTCSPTCNNLNPTCPFESCVDGCHCPEGTVLEGGQCIHISLCPCHYGSEIYEVGGTIQRDCNTCVCKGGQWQCTEEICPATCTVSSSHYTTFDGLVFNLVTSCSHYLLQHDNFSVTAEASTKCHTTPLPSCMRSITIHTPEGAIVKLKPEMEVTVNGQEITSLPVSAPGVYVSQATSLYMKAQLGSGLEILWDGRSTVEVTAPPHLFHQLRGLCGTFTHSQADDFLTPEGDVELTSSSFTYKWKVDDTCPQLPSEVDAVEERPCDRYPKRRDRASELCRVLNGPQFRECHDLVDQEPYYKVCMDDVCGCDSKPGDCLCSSLASYASACTRKGKPLPWRREVPECGLHCDRGQIYEECANPCLYSCAVIAGQLTCKEGCVEGCVCPPGLTLDSREQCVAISSCSCMHSGHVYPPEFLQRRGREMCECSDGHWSCRHASASDIILTPPPNVATHCSPSSHQESTECVSDCPLTCTNLHHHEPCTVSVCTPGCRCEEGYVLNTQSNTCVLPRECPCHHAGHSFEDGAEVIVDCNACVCEGGQWRCKSNPCPALCRAWGNSHYATFDGKMFDFQGECDYVLVRARVENDVQYSVVIQNVPCGTEGVTCSKSVVVSLDDWSLLLTRENPLPVVAPGSRLTVSQVGMFTLVHSDIGISLQWDRTSRVYVTAEPIWRSKLQGLCGDFNGDSTDDFRPPSGGMALVRAQAFADSWRVHDSCQPSRHVQDICDVHPERRVWAREKCGVLKSDLFRPCHSQVELESYYSRCVFDSCACDTGGDCQCLCAAVATYAQECARHDIIIPWRSQELCPIQCDECDRYSPCISLCSPKTCDTLEESEESQACSHEPCVDGCEPKPCKPGYVYKAFDNLTCVTEEECGLKPCIVINGVSYREGERIKDDEIGDPCQSCYCKRGEVECAGVPCITPSPPVPSVALIMDCELTGWTDWINSIDPAENGGDDFESLADLGASHRIPCPVEHVTSIQCRDVSIGTPSEATGQGVVCNLQDGLICRHDNEEDCLDYEMRVYCDCVKKVTCPPEQEWNGCVYHCDTVCQSLLQNLQSSGECDKKGDCVPGCATQICEPPYVARDSDTCVLPEDCTCRLETGYLLAPGEVVSNGCEKCQCLNNSLICSTLQECAPTTLGITTESFTTERFTTPGAVIGTEGYPQVHESSCSQGWSVWVNIDTPDFNGESEPLDEAHVMKGLGCLGGQFTAIECRDADSKKLHHLSGLSGEICDLESGYLCKISAQPDGRLCPDYEIRTFCDCKGRTLGTPASAILETTTPRRGAASRARPRFGAITTAAPCAYWSRWINKHRPRRGQDHGEREDTLPFVYRQTEGFCLEGLITEIECQEVRRSRNFQETKETNLICDLETGFTCHNSDQSDGRCMDYKIRYFCSCGGTTGAEVVLPLTATTPSHVYPCDSFVLLIDGPQPLDDAQLKASSSLSPKSGPQSGRLSSQSGLMSEGSWTAAVMDQQQFVEVDFGEPRAIYGVVTKGRENYNEWVTAYRLFYSPDGVGYAYYLDEHDEAQIFPGNYDSTSPVRHILKRPFEARVVRLEPVSWEGHLSLRWDLLGCSEAIATTMIPPAFRIPTAHPGRPTLHPPLEASTTTAPEMAWAVPARPPPPFTAVSTTLAPPRRKILPAALLPEATPPSQAPSRTSAIPGMEIPVTSTEGPEAILPEARLSYPPPFEGISTTSELPGTEIAMSTSEKEEPIIEEEEEELEISEEEEEEKAQARLLPSKFRVPRPRPFKVTQKPGTEIPVGSPEAPTAIPPIVPGQRPPKTPAPYPPSFRGSTLQPTEEFLYTTPSFIPPCDDFVLLIDGPQPVDDEHLQASSSLSPKDGAQSGRLTSDEAWTSRKSDKAQYIKVDLGESRNIYGVVTKGREDEENWVTSYRLQFSTDAANFFYYSDDEDNPKVFPANYDSASEVSNMLEHPIEARIVSLEPLTWEGRIALRWDLYGCSKGAAETTIAAPSTTPSISIYYTRSTPIPQVEVCEEPMGLENGLLPDSQLSASSYYDPSLSPEKGRIGSDSAWAAAIANDRQYLQADFMEPRNITGVITKGRDGVPQWVTAFNIAYSNDGTTWNKVLDDMENIQEFPGNYEAESVVTNLFPSMIRTRYLRIIPTKWKNWISLQAEVLGCFHPYECKEPMGLESGLLSNAQLSASSSYSKSLGPENARLSSTNAWVSETVDRNQYLQIDFLERVNLTAVVVKGRPGIPQWVTSYEVAHSDDGDTWRKVLDNYGKVKAFPGNSDSDSSVTNVFAKTLSSRYLRILPIRWSGWISMRAEVLGCHHLKVCEDPMGLEDGLLPDSMLTASSALDSYSGPSKARLNDDSAWSAGVLNEEQFLQVDFMEPRNVTAVVTKGKGDQPEWISSYQVAHSPDGEYWSDVEDEHGEVIKFKGNEDQNNPVVNLLPDTIETRFLRIIPKKWKKWISLRLEVLGCYHPYVCREPMGIENGLISDVQLAASSSFGGNLKPENARLDSDTAWTAATLGEGEYIQVDFVNPQNVTAVITRGRNDDAQWVTAYVVKVSDDGKAWTPITDDSTGEPKEFKANYDSDSPVTNTLPDEVSTRFIRILPTKWKNWISLRFDILGCYHPSVCTDPMGMDNSLLSDSQISASSYYDEFLKPANARLSAEFSAWAAENADDKQYLQIDFLEPRNVSAIVTKGRPDEDHWVSSYYVSYSDDDVTWTDVKDEMGKSVEFSGNDDRDTPVINPLPNTLETRYLRIVPNKWNNWISLRVEVLGCFHPYPTEEGITFTTEEIPPEYVKALYHGIELPPMVGGCPDPMEEESSLLPDAVITATSAAGGSTPSLIRLNTKASKGLTSGWVPRADDRAPEVLIQLPETKWITSIDIQGRGDADQWITAFRLESSDDSEIWKPIYDINGNEEMEGPQDQNTVVGHYFKMPVAAKFIKIIPKSWNRRPSLRMDLKGCSHPSVGSTEIPTVPALLLCPELEMKMVTDCPPFCPSGWLCNGQKCVDPVDCVCVKDDKIFMVSDKFEDESCLQCYCSLGGHTMCSPKICPPCKNGMKEIIHDNCSCSCMECENGLKMCPTSEECILLERWCDGIIDCPDDETDCPITTTVPTEFITEPPLEPENATCDILGTHINTLDGQEFNYDTCNHMILQDIKDGAFNVSVHKDCSQPKCERWLMVNHEDHYIKVSSELDVHFDGHHYTASQLVLLSRKSHLNMTIEKVGEHVIFKSLTRGFTLMYDIRAHLKAGASPDLMNSVAGLCGFYSGSAIDDQRKPNGKQAFTSKEFGDSWSLPESSGCEPFICPKEFITISVEKCQELRNDPFSVCGKTIDINHFVESCTTSMCECLRQKEGSPESCKCSNFLPMVEACEKSLGPNALRNWRYKHECVPDCPPGLKWDDCGPSCQLTCDTLSMDDCSKDCVAGCFCPPGAVLNGEICIPPDHCSDKVCQGFGDPHLETYDGLLYPFQAVGSFLITADEDLNFAIEGLTELCTNSAPITCVVGLQVIYKGHQVQVLKGKMLTIDGNEIPLDKLPVDIGDIHVLGFPGRTFIISIPAINVEARYFEENAGFAVKIPSRRFFNKTIGLCGNCNANIEDELKDEPINDFVCSWLTNGDEESCRKSFSTLPEVIKPVDICEKFNDTIFSSCHLLIDPKNFVDACSFDALHSDDDFGSFCKTAMEYARQCCQVGEVLNDWPEKFGCNVTCPSNLEFVQCHDGCPQTCESVKNESAVINCQAIKVDGCFCPDGKILKDDVCVDPIYCETCDLQGHTPGDVWKDGPCTNCHCGESLDVYCVAEICPGSPICRSDETLIRRDSGDESCCQEQTCVPIAKTGCPAFDFPSCPAGEVAVIQMANESCPFYDCECDKQLCPPIVKPVDIEVGQDYKMVDDGCCSRIEVVCDTQNCPKEPTCSPGLELIVMPGECCITYKCKPPKDVCLYTHQYEVVDGYEIKKKPSELGTSMYQPGDSWLNGLCENCSCLIVQDQLVPHCIMEHCPVVADLPENKDYELHEFKNANKCCPEIFRLMCKDEKGRSYEAFEEWQSLDNPCVNYVCEPTVVGDVQKVKKIIECPKCPESSDYIPPSKRLGQCCGICRPSKCEEDGTLYEVGVTWNDPSNPCQKAECVNNAGSIKIIYTNLKCPDLPNDCSKDHIIKDEDGCCDICNITSEISCSTGPIPLKDTVGFFSVVDAVHGGVCVNDIPVVDVLKCSGACHSQSYYSLEDGEFKSMCTCCKVNITISRPVELLCPDGSRIEKNFLQPSTCQCSKCAPQGKSAWVPPGSQQRETEIFDNQVQKPFNSFQQEEDEDDYDDVFTGQRPINVFQQEEEDSSNFNSWE